MPRLFIERLERFSCGLKRGTPWHRWERTLGGGLESHQGLEVDYRYFQPLPPELAGLVDAPSPHTTSLESEYPALVAELEAVGLAAGAARVEATVRDGRRIILAGEREAPRQDQGRTLQLELRLHAGAGATAQVALLERAFPSVEALRQQLPALKEAVVARAADALLKLEAVAAPEEQLPILIPPGSDAGVLFHELCGHPLEGDVVCRDGSFLARRRGETVAPAFVSVVDDPTLGPTTAGHGVDDEGTPARPAFLLREGRVEEPLLDLRSAHTLGLAPNGHGRRSTHRRFALPRMSHTQLQGHQGTTAQLLAGMERGLWITHLTPRRVDLLSGAFSFQIAEARWIDQGKLGPFLRPAILEGWGLEALAGIDRVGAEVETFFGMKGCGKLDQGGLPVSFGQPAVRFSPLTVRPGR